MFLQHLGLDEEAELIYRTILGHPMATIEEIQQVAGLGRAETLDVLDRLARLALVNWNGQAPALHLVEPTTALYALLARQESEVAERQLRLSASRQAIDHLLAARAAEEVTCVGMELVHGIHAVRHKLQEFAEGCQDYVWSLNPGGPQCEANLLKSRPLNEATLARGVKMRAIYQEAVHNDDPTVEHLRWLEEHGAEVRLASVLPLRMIIVDGDRATLVDFGDAVLMADDAAIERDRATLSASLAEVGLGRA